MNKVPSSDNALAGQIAQTGSKIKVHWSREEIGDTRWRSEWYVATVHKYCEETDMLTMLLRTCKNQIKPVMNLCISFIPSLHCLCTFWHTITKTIINTTITFVIVTMISADLGKPWCSAWGVCEG